MHKVSLPLTTSQSYRSYITYTEAIPVPYLLQLFHIDSMTPNAADETEHPSLHLQTKQIQRLDTSTYHQ